MGQVTYEEACEYILDIPKFAGKHTLADTKELLGRLTGSRIESKIIHVAGTNGKGSVCAYLQSILRAAGFHVGMFISPHLETMRERILYDGEMIPRESFVKAFELVREESDRQKEKHPSFFEFLFLMGMCYFKEKEPDYIILETGLGGRLDATNCIAKPKLCVITEIGFDHMQYLGNTLVEIAGEKAGIIKPGTPVIYLDKREETSRVIEQTAAMLETTAIAVKKSQIGRPVMRKKSIDFSFSNGYYRYDNLILRTTAAYQTENASVALVAARSLKEERIDDEAVRKGLYDAFWPGRMEEILPRVFLDGAHNEDGIEAFLTSVSAANTEREKAAGKRLLLFGVVADKQYDKMIGRVAASQLFSHIAVTVLASDRSASIDKLKVAWAQYKTADCSFHESAEEAFHYIQSIQKEADTIYIAGSLYLVGQIKTLVRRTPDD
jgi:dihydrofolate synthase/folylpolyglutamate synthase